MAYFKNNDTEVIGVLTNEGVVYVAPGEDLQYEEYDPEKPTGTTKVKKKSSTKKK